MSRGRPGLTGRVVPRGGDPVALTGLTKLSPEVDVRGRGSPLCRESLNWLRKIWSHVRTVVSEGATSSSVLKVGDNGLNSGGGESPQPLEGGEGVRGDRRCPLKMSSFSSAVSWRRAYHCATGRFSANRLPRYSSHMSVLWSSRHHQHLSSSGCLSRERFDIRRERFQLSHW